MEKKFLRVSEFAKEIGVHPNTIRNMEKDGRLLPHHVNEHGDRYYAREQIDQYFESLSRK